MKILMGIEWEIPLIHHICWYTKVQTNPMSKKKGGFGNNGAQGVGVPIRFPVLGFQTSETVGVFFSLATVMFAINLEVPCCRWSKARAIMDDREGNLLRHSHHEVFSDFKEYFSSVRLTVG